MLAPSTFRFLNETATLIWPGGWHDPARGKLWLYNLHYFDDLNAEAALPRASWHRDLIARWCEDNSVGRGNGWEPYPVSLRIANWIKWALAGHELELDWCESLAQQARWLERRIEWHLLGNHVWANAKALVFAGLFFDGAEGQRWLEGGLQILESEIKEQILPDGGHFERSPMYHAIVLEDLLDLINLARVYEGTLPGDVVARWRDVSRRMRTWLAAMSHPDGRIAFFNDACFGVAADPAALEAYAGRLAEPPADPPSSPVHWMRSSGYVRIARDGAVAIVDVAPIGPEYQPGHAHADTLSFELSVGAQRVVVNGGTSVYERGPERARQRGTAAHSTVEIGGADSSEVWSAFRVARRARVGDVRVSETKDMITIGATHDGYARLRGRPIPRREWRFGPRTLTVEDAISPETHDAVARFHLHPDVTVEVFRDGCSGRLGTAQGTIATWRSSSPVEIERSTWHPGFGIATPSRTLAVRFTTRRVVAEFTW